MKKKYNLGIIGFGGFGKFLYQAWSTLDSIEIVAVADLIQQESIDPTIKFFEKWEELLASDEIEIVSIATPPSTHAEIACAAMKSGKNVIIEKPMALSVEDARKIISTRDETGVNATVDQMMRFNPIIEFLAGWKERNPFGKLIRAAVENYAQDEALPQDHWFWDKNISGGILVEHGIHFFDLINFISGSDVKEIHGWQSERNENMVDKVFANVEYENGLLASHYHSFSRPGIFEDTSIKLSYDLAQVEINGWIPLSGKIMALVNDNTLKDLEKLPGIIISEKQPVENIRDESRPEGWGNISINKKKGIVQSGGIEYQADSLVRAKFKLDKNKSEIYKDCLRDLITGFISVVEGNDEIQTVSLEDGLKSLETAILASTSFTHETN